MIKAAILTVSDTRTKESDTSGRTLEKLLNSKQFTIVHYDIVQDEQEQIKNKLTWYADLQKIDLVLTTGGTGLGPRDVTPEATEAVLDKKVPGISDYIRMVTVKNTERSLLSRGVAGVRKKTLIINLPGSPRGAQESLEAVLDVIPHALEMIQGKGH